MPAKLALQRTNIVVISNRLQPSKRFRILKRDGVPLLVTSRRCSAFVEANIVLSSTIMAHFLGQLTILETQLLRIAMLKPESAGLSMAAGRPLWKFHD